MSLTSQAKYQRAHDVTILGIILASMAGGMMVMCILPQVQFSPGTHLQNIIAIISSSYVSGVALMIVPQLYIRKKHRQSAIP